MRGTCHVRKGQNGRGKGSTLVAHFPYFYKGGIGPTEAVFWIAAAVPVADSRTGNEPRLNSPPKNCDFSLLQG